MSRSALLRAAAVVTTAAALLALAAPVLAAEGDTPSVAVTPAHPPPRGPNRGAWFTYTPQRGATVIDAARVANPARVSQRVRIYFADLAFGDDGTPSVVTGDQSGVGAWGHPDDADITLGPGQQAEMSFRIAVPTDADPGDHVGVFVAETTTEQGGFTVNRQVATRVYVTVPGQAHRAMAFDRADLHAFPRIWPRRAEVIAYLRNQGNIRLQPSVTIGGQAARGSEAVVTKSVEPYTAEVTVPWYGGPVSVPVMASAGDGLQANATASAFVVPWLLVAIALLVLVTTGQVLRIWGRRRRRSRGASVVPVGDLLSQPIRDQDDLEALLGRIRQAAEDTLKVSAAP